jgi:hypothetical protein
MAISYSRKWGKMYCDSWDCISSRKSEFYGWCCLNCSRDMDIKQNDYSRDIMRCWTSKKLSTRKPELRWWCCLKCKTINDNKMAQKRKQIDSDNRYRHNEKIQKTAHTPKGYRQPLINNVKNNT